MSAHLLQQEVVLNVLTDVIHLEINPCDLSSARSYLLPRKSQLTGAPLLSIV